MVEERHSKRSLHSFLVRVTVSVMAYVSQAHSKVHICSDFATLQQMDVLSRPLWLPFPTLRHYASHVCSMVPRRFNALPLAQTFPP